MFGIKQKIEHYVSYHTLKRFFFIFLISSFFGFIFYSGYTLIKTHIESKASKDLLELMDRFYGAYSIGTIESLEEIKNDSMDMYIKNKWSNLAPFFIICSGKVSSLLENHEEALKKMDSALAFFNKKNYFYYISRLLYAQALIATEKEINFEKSIVLLNELINSKEVIFKEIGLYFKGLYYFMYKSLSEADIAWYELLNDPLYLESPWKIKAKLARNCNVPF